MGSESFFPDEVVSGKIVVFVVAHLPEYGVGVEGCAACYEFSVCGSESKQYRVVQFLVVLREIGFIPPYSVECVASDCVGIVRESLNDRAVWNTDSCLLQVQTLLWEVAAEA